MTIKSQIFTAEHLDGLSYLTPYEKEQRALPATPAQIKYIMILLWNKGIHTNEFLLPASTYIGIPTADDLEQYNRSLASGAIEWLKECSRENYGLHSMRKSAASEDYGWSRYLGNISDHTADL
ncbi:hypothetical protein [Corynebacterium ulceribovis]|uniref:hypothetical protein n=1 Tax=Corynebacterium ulceribovis TaxID=487732 RepID=UPI0003656D67|nr:hypothetical protein [Corynebacterium ulceribovis]